MRSMIERALENDEMKSDAKMLFQRVTAHHECDGVYVCALHSCMTRVQIDVENVIHCACEHDTIAPSDAFYARLSHIRGYHYTHKNAW